MPSASDAASCVPSAGRITAPGVGVADNHPFVQQSCLQVPSSSSWKARTSGESDAQAPGPPAFRLRHTQFTTTTPGDTGCALTGNRIGGAQDDLAFTQVLGNGQQFMHARPVAGAFAVPGDEPNADQDQKESTSGQNVSLSGSKAAAGGTQTADKAVNFLPFSEAILHARSLRLKNSGEWKSDARLGNIPFRPELVYKYKGWQGYVHWLGTSNIATGKQEYLPFAVALLYARSLKLKGAKQWRVGANGGGLPANVPSHPDATYKHDGWEGWGHWLGTDSVRAKTFLRKKALLPFSEALLYARSLKLKTQKEWYAWRKSCGRPANIPSTPDQVYKLDGWQGYGHWLGTGTVAPKNKQFLPFKKALLRARSLKLKNRIEWREWSQSSARPANMPSAPDQVYQHEGWQGYGHWLRNDSTDTMPSATLTTGTTLPPASPPSSPSPPPPPPTPPPTPPPSSPPSSPPPPPATSPSMLPEPDLSLPQDGIAGGTATRELAHCGPMADVF